VHELDVTPQGVFYEGQRVDVVFTMYTWLETRQYVPHDVTTRLIEADEAGVVDFVSPPLSALYDHKANLEILTSGVHRHHFTDGERAVLDRYVPRTWRLTDDTLKLAARDRAGFVLKPATEYGGKGIVFGDQVGDEVWRATLSASLDRDATYVLQERLGDLWSYDDPDGATCRKYQVCLGPMIFGGRYAGTFMRHAPATTGGSAINTARGAEAASLLVLPEDAR